uniref:Peptidase S74 domain-containing protein n=1 Tax=viral metagenome TaxID=1070528 RepID=A0A6C0KSS7_9ZZZZ
MASPDISNLLIYNSTNDISYIEYNRTGIPYNFDATYIYHNNQNYNDGSYSTQLGTINNNLIIESATSNILLSTAENRKVVIKNSMAVNANLDVSNVLKTNILTANDISLNNILYLNSSTSLVTNIIGDLKIQGSITQVTGGASEERSGFSSNNASLTTSTFRAGDISFSDIFSSNIYSSNITNSYISNTAIGYTSNNIGTPNKAVFTDVSLQSLTLTGTSYLKFLNNPNNTTNNPTIIQSSNDYSKLEINKPLIVGLSQDTINISNISIFNGDISCNTLYYKQLYPDIRLNNYFDVSIGKVSLSGSIIPTSNMTFNIGSNAYKFNNIYSSNFIGDLSGSCSIANNLVKNLDMSFNNLDISGIIRVGGLNLNDTLTGTYLTISGADLSFQELSGRIIDLSRNVYSRSYVDTCLNTNYVKTSTTNATQFRIFDKFTFESSGVYTQQIASPYNSTIISEWRTNWLSSNNPVIRFHSDGSITNINNSYSGWSDIRLKENVVNTGPKLQDLLKVRVVNYNLKGSASTNKHIGVIAQELETIFPSLVSENEPTIEDINAGKIESYKSVKYSCFTLILIKALQEEQEIINKLDSRIEVLNEEYKSIKDLQEETRLLSATINTLKEENVILKYKLDEILSSLRKNIIV